MPTLYSWRLSSLHGVCCFILCLSLYEVIKGYSPVHYNPFSKLHSNSVNQNQLNLHWSTPTFANAAPAQMSSKPTIIDDDYRRPFNLTAISAGDNIQYKGTSREFHKDTTIEYSGPSSYQVRLRWKNGPKRILLVSKPDPEITKTVRRSVSYLRRRGLEVVVDEAIYNHILNYQESPSDSDIHNEDTTYSGLTEDLDWNSLPSIHKFKHDLTDTIDLVLCFGGDGLIMHTNTLFLHRSIPPVICFDFGSLGFLAPFCHTEFHETVEKVLEGEVMLTLRMRLQCTIIRENGERSDAFHVLNEAVIDRGPSPYLCNMDLFCDDQFLTTVQADGLIIATPTGSTAYSLSAGGSMVHPSVPAILLTPICAHTLSFRPLLLPDSCLLRCSIPAEGRGTGWVSFDGKFRQELGVGDSLEICMSKYPMPTVNRLNFTADWFESLRHAFMFNQRPRQKPLSPK